MPESKESQKHSEIFIAGVYSRACSSLIASKHVWRTSRFGEPHPNCRVGLPMQRVKRSAFVAGGTVSVTCKYGLRKQQLTLVFFV
jgi:hypothetical protein